MGPVIRLESSNGRPLAVVRRRARPHELARVVPDACGVVWTAARAQPAAAPGRHVAVYLDGQINLEIGVEVDGPFAANGEVVPSATPAGPTATATHLGPYSSLGQTHDAIRQWCTDHGHALAGPSWEVYGHWQADWNADPARIRTDIYYLLKPAVAPAG